MSSAKILVDRSGDERDPNTLKCITITGTKDQIRTAVIMIDEKLAEEQAFQQKMALSSVGRASLYRGRPLAIRPNVSSSKVPDVVVVPEQNRPMQVLGTCLPTPSCFLQIFAYTFL